MNCAICDNAISEREQPKCLYGNRICHGCGKRYISVRQAAYVVDLVVFYLGLRFLVWVCGFSGIMGSVGRASDWMGLVGVMLAGRFIFIFKDGFRGRSPGKVLFGLVAVHATTACPIGFLDSFCRNIVLVIPLIGEIIVALSLRHGKRIGDRDTDIRIAWLRMSYRKPFCSNSSLCHHCGYSLQGSFSGKCSECGTPG